VLAACCAFALSASRAQDAVAPGSAPAGPLLRNAGPPLEDTASPEFQARLAWRRAIAQKPTPKPGCFTMAFPSTEWTETPCSTATPRPHPLRLVDGPLSAGRGNSPVLTTDTIFSATGILAQVSGVTSESDPTGAGHWSLQLNTNTFNSPLCGGQAGCSGWEQFIVDNPGNVYVQYWLKGHANPCPAVPSGFSGGWNYYAGAPGQASGCYINGNQNPAPQQGLDGLQSLRLTGGASAVAQTSRIEIANGFFVVSTDAGDPLSIGRNWNQAEFNIFGVANGTNITFNEGASIIVQIEGEFGEVPPKCVVGGFTAETNNLNPISPCEEFSGGIEPGVRFTEDLIPAIPGCSYPSVTAACVPIPGSTFIDAAFLAACPAGGVTMQQMSGGVWQPLPLHCSDGLLPGRCNPGATVANQFVIGTQRYGAAFSGAPVGSSPNVEVCDNASHCSRFALTVPNCPSSVAPGDSFMLSEGNNPIEVVSGGTIEANLVLDGPWVANDHGVGAIGSTFDGAGLPPGMIVTLSQGVSGAPHTYGLMNVFVEAPPDAPPGDYRFQAKATDLASNVTLRAVVPLRILACKPSHACSSVFNQKFCGLVSNGCGGSFDCGGCAVGVCSKGSCCPDGTTYEPAVGFCIPNSCPAGMSYCLALNDCETANACDKATKPVCHRINGKLKCE
jgi:hypothetical protein